jgi:hypothetical protein
MSGTPGQWTFSIAIILSVSSALLAFVSVCVYLLDQSGCGPAEIVETRLWASYSWLALATASTTLLSLIASFDNDCAGPRTIKGASILSIVMLSALTILSGVISVDAHDHCVGDSKDGLFGMTLASCISSGLGALLWAASFIQSNYFGGNFGAKFGSLAPRYRRVRQFA